ncbi:hypothetical protein NPX13_g5787 [Xylaria arbuscula]|uniref:Mucin n=1 Tax=Xylaria arbuscula TaxID=114810 RepID=A0A9W8NDH1_9PEZI|nr:hypothetical protein NPX13_g5787 [Xylaria arbuscula]
MLRSMDMGSMPTDGKQLSAFDNASQNGLFDSLSWLDEDDDLNLRLTLDDYQHDLNTSRPTTTAGPPSLFRRRLSVNKLSFSRSSISSRPGTRDSSTTDHAPVKNHSRRKSRAFSLITPKHSAQASVASIDLAATHYQDPEARHKLRAYLASPQKFDEALEYGFPANHAYSNVLPTAVPTKHRMLSRGLVVANPERLKTFLADDSSSIYSEETSIPDSESPRTPHTPEDLNSLKPFPLSGHGSALPRKLSEGFAHGPMVPREMTLRMTLTRPDLRSRQDESYGNSNGVAPRSSSSQLRPPMRPFLVDSPVVESDNDVTKESMDQIFADIDRELGSPSENVVKRFWNRIRKA